MPVFEELTDTSLANAALQRVGMAPIANIEDAGIVEETCKLLLNIAYHSVLRKRPWNCAIKRATLDLAAENLASDEFTFAYNLPTDPLCIRANYIVGKPKFRIEGRILYTDQVAPQLVYNGGISAPEMDALLFDAVATYLASDLATSMVRDQRMASSLLQIYQAKFSEAAGTDEAEQDDEESIDLTGIR